MLDALEPILERLTDGTEPDDPLLRGPRGGVLTTATVRDATHRDDLVAKLGFDNLTRHGLRHTGATWMSENLLEHMQGDAGVGHLAEAARQANQFLSAAPAKKDASRRDGHRL